jgi:hypothetical protein
MDIVVVSVRMYGHMDFGVVVLVDGGRQTKDAKLHRPAQLTVYIRPIWCDRFPYHISTTLR